MATPNELLEEGLLYLRTHQEVLVSSYAQALELTLGLPRAYTVAKGSVEGLLSRLGGRPLDSSRLWEMIQAHVREGRDIEKLVEASNQMLGQFRQYLIQADPQELPRPVRDELIRRAETITQRHISNVRLTALRAALEETPDPIE